MLLIKKAEMRALLCQRKKTKTGDYGGRNSQWVDPEAEGAPNFRLNMG